MPTHLLFSVGIILILGLLAGQLANRLKLPAVTGYILVGLLLGPAVGRMISYETIFNLKPLSDFALGIIALVIGGEMEIKFLHKLGRALLLITFLEVLGAFIVVSALFMVFGVPTYLAIIFGAMAMATAPGGTVAVIREARAKGPLTDSLLAVVALDDALCVAFFGIIIAFTRILNGSATALQGSANFIWPIYEILGSIALGFSAGYLANYLYSRFRRNSFCLTLTLGAIFVVFGLAESLHLSPLLSNMALGFYLVNICRDQKKIFSLIEGIEVPIFIAFFTLAGAGLEVSLLAHVGIFGLLYFFGLAIGKNAGSYLGAKLGGAPEVVQRYLGLGLIPQAGVVIGLMVVASQQYPEQSHFFTNVILASVIMGEVIGPILTRWALARAGEIEPSETESREEVSL